MISAEIYAQGTADDDSFSAIARSVMISANVLVAGFLSLVNVSVL